MSLIQLLIISLIQGITEWLPVSSSGHVLLASSMFGLGSHDELMINAMAHLGTLGAVLIYFWRDVARAFSGGVELVTQPLRKGSISRNAWLAALILASLPIALIVGVVHEMLLPERVVAGLRSVWTVAATTLIFGLILWWADVRGAQRKTIHDMTLFQAILIGASQAIAAVLPGTSRSGITMTTARWLGFERTEAARFSMLIGAPILAAGGAYAVLELLTADGNTGAATLSDGLIVAALSLISGLASIWALMKLLEKISFLPFVIYRIILAIVLILLSPLALGWITA